MTAEPSPQWSPNWLPIEEVHLRLWPSIGNIFVAADKMTMAFAGLSRMPYVRTLRCWHRRPDRERINDPRLWAVKFKITPSSPGHLQIDRRVYDAARRRIGWVRPLQGYTHYAWLPDLAEAWPSVFAPVPAAPPSQVEVTALPEIKMAASQPDTPSSPRKVTAKEWITSEAQRLKRCNMIRVGIGKTEFAKLLATNMKKAARTDTSILIKPVDYTHILNNLAAWGLWPIDAIE